MGRHSRRARPETATDTPPTAGPPADGPSGGTSPGPGPGRRRREPFEGDVVRGGHPEQREPGGGWGEFPGAPASPAAPGQGAPRIPRPRAEMSAGPALAAPGSGPGPRREYVDAFDAGRFPGGQGGPGGASDPDDDVFRAGAPRTAGQAAGAYGPGADGVAPGGRYTGRSVVFDRNEIDELDRQAEFGADGAGPGGPGGQDPDDGFDAEESRHGAQKGGKGRTFTGAAAAAVTTVLAVVIAGQVAEQHKESGDPQPRSGNDRTDGLGDEASRSHSRPTQDAKPASYDEKMNQVFPLDAELTATGRFKPAGGDAEAPGKGKVLRYRVDIEEGLPLDGELFAEAVHKTLNDSRSWAHGGKMAFQRVGSGDADFVITLASPGTTDKWCAKSNLDTSQDKVSCDSAATERVMINAYRWAQGARTYGHDKMHAYRQMLINHEVGHRLGHNHEVCSRQGALAPVMMQQTKFLTTDGATCRPNSWPFPTQR
ncbi:DUF3152 domain-containing protein [Streptomyces libani]|uniref:DUF3152 domain-containing protein n=1 Tax=Streptomyces nigrescens TaxID=1920 RepID=UPI00237E10D4|nr:DUF3152 domain-containing protein [Streptomyces sp. G7(2002)]WDT57432.1 DUF3152 domain-containing protein [Streptomyces sp. G7(2002)]